MGYSGDMDSTTKLVNEILKYGNIAFIVATLIQYLFPLVLYSYHVKMIWYLKGLIYLLFFSPTYAIIIGIYSACNTHDISWGSWPTGNEKENEEEWKWKEVFEDFRANYFAVWVIVNLLVGYFLCLLFWN